MVCRIQGRRVKTLMKPLSKLYLSKPFQSIIRFSPHLAFLTTPPLRFWGLQVPLASGLVPVSAIEQHGDIKGNGTKP